MKNILLILAIAFSSASFGQGNLQFNQVLGIDMTGTSAAGGHIVVQTSTITVPAGKVWKIESANCRIAYTNSAILYGSSANNRLIMTVDNVAVCHVAPANSSESGLTELPMWLPAGTYNIELVAYISSAFAHTFYGKATVIEFNVVP